MVHGYSAALVMSVFDLWMCYKFKRFVPRRDNLRTLLLGNQRKVVVLGSKSAYHLAMQNREEAFLSGASSTQPDGVHSIWNLIWRAPVS